MKTAEREVAKYINKIQQESIAAEKEAAAVKSPKLGRKLTQTKKS